jgi:hypothetical protein
LTGGRNVWDLSAVTPDRDALAIADDDPRGGRGRHIFSKLMADVIEPPRESIPDNALSVPNLHV